MSYCEEKGKRETAKPRFPSRVSTAALPLSENEIRSILGKFARHVELWKKGVAGRLSCIIQDDARTEERGTIAGSTSPLGLRETSPIATRHHPPTRRRCCVVKCLSRAMFPAGPNRPGQWLPLLIQRPGSKPEPVGVMLFDTTADKLSIKLMDEPAGIDEDTREVWSELGDDLKLKAQEMGGRALLRWLEENASNTFQVGPREDVQIDNPDLIFDLYQRNVLGSMSADRQRVADIIPIFSREDISAARNSLRLSPAVTLGAMKKLTSATASVGQIEKLVSLDPTLAGHLIKASNAAFLPYRDEARSISQAIMRLGFDRTRLLFLGFSFRQYFSTPRLRRVWDHSIQVTQAARSLCNRLPWADAQEVTLLALVHDIAQLNLLALGPTFERRFAELQQTGDYEVQIERKLCGTSHAEIGADLLQSWFFPADMVEAVRHHHIPDRSDLRLTAFLHLIESWTESDEDVFDPAVHSRTLDLLQITKADLSSLAGPIDPELSLLRFAA